ncbi:hypothetical protein MCP1_150056 [Candidatus Terasakiella magnetica]|nr:hypothetical protein MCP1_150056 [Candidatus Terasakiella magnetica]
MSDGREGTIASRTVTYDSPAVAFADLDTLARMQRETARGQAGNAGGRIAGPVGILPPGDRVLHRCHTARLSTQTKVGALD